MERVQQYHLPRVGCRAAGQVQAKWIGILRRYASVSNSNKQQQQENSQCAGKNSHRQSSSHRQHRILNSHHQVHVLNKQTDILTIISVRS